MDILRCAIFLRLVENLIVALEGGGRLLFYGGQGTFTAVISRGEQAVVEEILDRNLSRRNRRTKTWMLWRPGSSNQPEVPVIRATLRSVDAQTRRLRIVFPVALPPTSS